MQAFISKYGLAAHLALLAVAPLFLFPFFPEGTVSVATLWLSLVALIWVLMEPSRRSDERLHEARLRVRGAIARDPFTWLMVFVCLFAALPALNGDLARVYDPNLRKWVMNDPLVANLPRAAAGKGLAGFSCAVALAVVLTGCRQALGKSARIAFPAVVGLLAGAVSLVLVARGWTPEDPLVSSCGTAFGLAALGAVVSAAGVFECKWNRQMLLFSFGTGASLTGLFFFATPAELALYGGLWLLAFAGCLAYVFFTQGLPAFLKYLVLVLIAFAVPVLASFFLAPEGLAAERFGILFDDGFFPGGLFPEGFFGNRAELMERARAFWNEHPWIGGGAGSFGPNLWLAGAAREGSVPAGPLNGYWGLLAERGMLGAVVVLVPLGFMTVTLVVRVVRAWGRPVFLPLPALGVAGLLAVAAGAFVSSSCSRPETILLAGAFYALAASSFPLPRKTAEDDAEKTV